MAFEAFADNTEQQRRGGAGYAALRPGSPHAEKRPRSPTDIYFVQNDKLSDNVRDLACFLCRGFAGKAGGVRCAVLVAVAAALGFRADLGGICGFSRGSRADFELF